MLIIFRVRQLISGFVSFSRLHVMLVHIFKLGDCSQLLCSSIFDPRAHREWTISPNKQKFLIFPNHIESGTNSLESTCHFTLIYIPVKMDFTAALSPIICTFFCFYLRVASKVFPSIIIQIKTLCHFALRSFAVISWFTFACASKQFDRTIYVFAVQHTATACLCCIQIVARAA